GPRSRSGASHRHRRPRPAPARAPPGELGARQCRRAPRRPATPPPLPAAVGTPREPPPVVTEIGRVRAVVLNFNGGDLTLACLRRLRATEWPVGRFQVVLVDNASSDGVVDRTRDQWPDIRIITSDRNLGFAGGCNLALHDLHDVDAVALVNNDVLVEPGWLAPLARALGHNPRVGAA